MGRTATLALAALVTLALALPAQEGIQKGTLKKVDADKGTLTVTVDGTDHDLTVTEQTRIFGPGMKPVEDRLKNPGFKPGAAVLFKAEKQDGKLVLVGLKLGGDGDRPAPPGDILRAKIRKVDTERMTVTLTVDGKDQEFAVTDDTRFLGADGPVKDGLKDRAFRPGADVFFKAVDRDGKRVLLGIKIAGPGQDGGTRPNPKPKLERVDTSKLKPLTELGKDRYQDFPGGLYLDGLNERPPAHEAAGLALAKQVQPLNAEGKPDPEGKIVLLSVGMSNTTQAFSMFKQLADADKEKNPRLTLVDGAQGGMTAARIKDAEDGGGGTRFWTTVDQRLKAAGATRAQVQAAWIKQADAGPTQGFPGYARQLQGELATIVRLMHERFPNLKLVYLSSRTYAGYARTPLNPEPYAYESGFSVKWLIDQQLKGEGDLNYDADKGPVKAPWLSWGPYLWANGTTARADGFSYAETDFSSDGTHPSNAGRQKVGEQLLKFFKTDTTTKRWFLQR